MNQSVAGLRSQELSSEEVTPVDINPMKVCILGATFNTPNLGVSVLAAGAIRCVLHSFPQARITQLDYASDAYDFKFQHCGRPIPVRFVNIRFSKRLYLHNNIAFLIALALVSRLIPSQNLRERLLVSNDFLKEIAETDLVVSLAGGDSFSDIYGLRRLLYTTLPQLLTVFLRKRLILLPQTIGPFRLPVSRVIARHILDRAEVVYSRDAGGETATQALLGPGEGGGKVKFCYDLGFDVDARPPAELNIDGFAEGSAIRLPVVGFNVSGLLMMGGYDQNNMFGLGVSYERLVLRLIDFFIEEKSAPVLLIPHVFGTTGESDANACERVFETLKARYPGKIGLVRGSHDYAETKYLIGQCEFFVGARMHACIGALSQGVPAISIAYSDKFAGVMQTIGCQELVADPRQMDENEMIQVVESGYRRRAILRSELELRMPIVRKTIRATLRNVKAAAR